METKKSIKTLLETYIQNILEQKVKEQSFPREEVVINLKQDDILYFLIYLLLNKEETRAEKQSTEQEINTLVKKIEALREKNRRLLQDISPKKK